MHNYANVITFSYPFLSRIKYIILKLKLFTRLEISFPLQRGRARKKKKRCVKRNEA